MAIVKMASEEYVDGKVGAKYTKPESGIPKDDLAPGVRASLDAADAAAPASTTYTKLEVDDIVDAAKNGRFAIVQALPPAGEAEEKVIYLLPRTQSESGNVYDEYVVVSGAWERLGSTEIDLTGYVQTNDPRLSDERTPTAHKSSHAAGGADALTPADIDAQPAGDYANSESIAPDYDPNATYDQNEHVTYNGRLYYANQAITAPEPWTPAHWTENNMTTPDATLDITAAGSLRVVAANGDVLWQQGYRLASESGATLSNEGSNLFAFAAAYSGVSGFDATAAYAQGDTVAYAGKVYVFNAAHAAGAWIGTDADLALVTQSFSLPAVPNNRVGDYILSIDNTANTLATAIDVAEYTGGTISLIVPKGSDLNEMFTIEGGARCELYFTQSPLAIDSKPTWKVVRQDVEVVA